MPTDERLRDAVEGLLGPVRDMPVLKLNIEAVGDRLIRLVAISAVLGHSRPEHSVRYVRQGPEPETEFVLDVLTMTTAQLATKWFGGQEGAERLGSLLMTSPALIDPGLDSPA